MLSPVGKGGQASHHLILLPSPTMSEKLFQQEIRNPGSTIRIIIIVITALPLSKDFLVRLTRCWLGIN